MSTPAAMKEPLLLLPGMMCDARLFTPQIEYFSATRPVMVMPITRHASVAALAAEVLEHAPPHFALAGLSMGGIVAMEIIRRAPARVTRLALLDTNPLAETPERAQERDAQIERARIQGLASVIRDEVKPQYLADGPHVTQILDTCLAMAESLGINTFVSQSRALQSRRDQCDTLRDIDVPTLILCGEQDSLCPVEKHRMMHALVRSATLALIPGAGHLPTLEQPSLTNSALTEWLQR